MVQYRGSWFSIIRAAEQVDRSFPLQEMVPISLNEEIEFPNFLLQHLKVIPLYMNDRLLDSPVFMFNQNQN
jgi:hypothetical protein